MTTHEPTPQRKTPATPSVDDPRRRLLERLPVVERRRELAGVSTAVLEGGEGPPLVLLHGPGEHAPKWLRVIPRLVERHRVVAPDLPGHGASEVREGALDVDRVLAWLDALLDETCDQPPVLVGQILGGAIAARYAAARGDRLRALVLVDALGLAPFSPAPAFGSALFEFAARPSEETHDRLWERCAHDLGALRRGMGESWSALKAYNLDRAGAPALREHQQRLFELFAIPAIPATLLDRIEVPTMLVWGRHDLATSLQVAEEARARHGWPLRVIEGAADDPPIEQPDAFVDALFDGLEAVRRADDARAAWDRIAAGYDRTNTVTQMALGDEALRRAGLRPGMRFLDVASGSGALAIPAARLGAQVLATDLSPAMLALLRARAEQVDLSIDARAMDGQALALADETFDMAGSQFGVMLFPDMPKGLREMARVVKPGGRVLVVAYGDPRRVDFLTFLVDAVRTVRPAFSGPPSDPPPLPFQLHDPERLRRELAAAGLKDVVVETLTETTEFHGGAELWDWILWSNPIVSEILGGLALGDDEIEQVKGALEEQVRARAGGPGPARLENPVHVGFGTK